MNANGKKARNKTGMNRNQIHFSAHSHKSAAKRRKMGWGKSGAPMTKNNQ